MHHLYEVDSPDDNYVNADTVINHLIVAEQESLNVKAILLSKRKWGLSGSGKLNHSFIFPAAISNSINEILKAAQEGFAVFIYTASSVLEVVNTLKKYGYILGDQAVSLSELPMDASLQKEMLEFISNFEWKGRVIFFAHDGLPVYILDSECR